MTPTDLFLSIISAAILVQLRELENATETAMSALRRTSWASLKQVSGTSAYVADLEYALESFTDMIKPLVEQKKYLKNFFDKAAG
jgi:vacuolar protein sorting-associated protein 53